MNALLRARKYGEVSEWFKELVLKTSDSERDRGFESHLLRLSQAGGIMPRRCDKNYKFKKWFYTILPYGEVPKLAEGTPLERVQVVNSGARVQIPPSPLLGFYRHPASCKKIKKVLTACK